jgi:Flp pilus assembly protein TadB
MRAVRADRALMMKLRVAIIGFALFILMAMALLAALFPNLVRLLTAGMPLVMGAALLAVVILERSRRRRNK